MDGPLDQPPGTFGFAYLFDRFPSSTRNFLQREVRAVQRLGLNPLLISIREPDDPLDVVPPELAAAIYDLPPEEELWETWHRWIYDGLPPERLRQELRYEEQPEKRRLYEALHLGPRLRELGIRHVHAHFGGLAARTAYWIDRLFGISFSFTGHANDIFCETDSSITRAELVRAASFVVTEAIFSQRWLQQRHPAAARKIHRVYNGIDLEEYRPVNPADAPREIVTVGRLIEKKGFPVLIEACGILARAGEEFHCTIIGSGPLEETLRGLIAEHRLEGRVTLAGHQQEPAVRAALDRARLFALACVTEADGGMDNLPTVIVEAMATGLPVVSTPIAGVPEMVTNHGTGMIVPERDPAALAEAMRRLLAEPELARTLGLAGRKEAEKTFDARVSARQLGGLLVKYGGAILPTPSARREGDWWWREWQQHASPHRWQRAAELRWRQLRKRSL